VINGAVAVLIGLYLILALWRDNESAMIKTISEQSGFIKWAGALLTLGYLYSVFGGKGGEVVKGITIVALAAMILGNGDKMFKQMAEVFNPTNNGSK